MTNAELIKALRYCADEDKICTEQTNCGYYGKGLFCQDVLMRDAADALEAAEKRIAILEEERDLERFAAKNYLDKIDELEAQLPKEGEWIEVHDWLHIPQEERGTYRCSACGQVMKYPWNYCPNCGCRMDGETK